MGERTMPNGRVESERDSRDRRVAEALHSGEMEGSHVTAAGRTDAQEYVVGHIDSDALVARARARYGLS